MTPQQYVGLAARLYSIWLAITAVRALGYGLMATDMSRGASGALSALVVALCMAAALGLWLFPMSLARRLVPPTRFEGALQLPSRQALVVACVIVGGCLIVFRALPAFSAYGAVVAFTIAGGDKITSLPPDQHIDLLVGIVEMGVGVGLVRRAHAVVERLLPAGA